jgi:hypothetical protein
MPVTNENVRTFLGPGFCQDESVEWMMLDQLLRPLAIGRTRSILRFIDPGRVDELGHDSHQHALHALRTSYCLGDDRPNWLAYYSKCVRNKVIDYYRASIAHPEVADMPQEPRWQPTPELNDPRVEEAHAAWLEILEALREYRRLGAKEEMHVEALILYSCGRALELGLEHPLPPERGYEGANWGRLAVRFDRREETLWRWRNTVRGWLHEKFRQSPSRETVFNVFAAVWEQPTRGREGHGEEDANAEA